MAMLNNQMVTQHCSDTGSSNVSTCGHILFLSPKVDQIFSTCQTNFVWWRCVKMAAFLICWAKGSVLFFLSKSREDFFALRLKQKESRVGRFFIINIFQWHFGVGPFASTTRPISLKSGLEKRQFVGLQLGQLEFWDTFSYTLVI